MVGYPDFAINDEAEFDVLSRLLATLLYSQLVAPFNTSPAPLAQICYILITANSPDCLNPETFSAPPPQLQYRFSDTSWITLEPGEQEH